MKFKIYRYNPDADTAPYMRDYDLDIEPGNMMLLDALLLIKEQDDSLSLRKSCREGVCGSDAMNINGRNGLTTSMPAILFRCGFMGSNALSSWRKQSGRAQHAW